MNNPFNMNTQNLLQEIYQFKMNSSQLIRTYDCYYICQFIEMEVITDLENSQLNSKKGCDVVDFVRVLINVVPHYPYENLYIIIGIIDLFKEIAQSRLIELVKLQDLTDFICENHSFIFKDPNPKVEERPSQQQAKFIQQYGNDLMITTSKDIRFLSSKSGKIEKVVEFDAEVSQVIPFNKQIIIGFQNGQIKQQKILFICKRLYDSSFHVNKQFCGHQNEISQLYIDYQNKMLASAGYDACVQVQLLQGKQNDVKKRITNYNNGKAITLLAISVYHNLMITASESPILYLWDYELNKFLEQIQIVNYIIIYHKPQEPLFILFINAHPIIFVSSQDGFLYILQFQRRDTIIDLWCTAKIQFDFATQLLSLDPEQRQRRISELSPKLVEQSNEIQIQRRRSLAQSKGIKFKRTLNYEDNDVVIQPAIIEPNNFCSKLEYLQKNIYAALNTGLIIVFNVEQILADIKITKFIIKKTIKFYIRGVSCRVNYNPMRQSDVDFQQMIEHTKIKKYSIESGLGSPQSPFKNQKSCKKSKQFIIVFTQIQNPYEIEPKRLDHLAESIFKAHNKIVTLAILQLDKYYLITTGFDCLVKIWSIPDHTLVACVSMDNKIKKWELSINDEEQYKRKIIFALKIIESLLTKYNLEISNDERKLLTLDALYQALKVKDVTQVKSKKTHKKENKKYLSLDQNQIQTLIEKNSIQPKSGDHDPDIEFLFPDFRARAKDPKLIISEFQYKNPRIRVNKSAYLNQRLERDLDNRVKPIETVVAKRQSDDMINHFKRQSQSIFKGLQEMDDFSGQFMNPSRVTHSNYFIDQNLNKTQSTNFYKYANEKKLLTSSSSEVVANRKIFTEVIDKINQKKRRAAVNKQFLTSFSKIKPTTQTQSTFAGLLETPIHSKHIQRLSQEIKVRVSEFYNGSKEQEEDKRFLIEKLKKLKDPDFDTKLNYASQFGLMNFQWKKRA